MIIKNKSRVVYLYIDLELRVPIQTENGAY